MQPGAPSCRRRLQPGRFRRWPAGFPLPISRSPCPPRHLGAPPCRVFRWSRSSSRSSSSASASWRFKPALATFFGALGCAGLSILVGFAAFAAIWQNGSRGMGRILLAFLIDVLILAYPAYLGLQYRKLPPIHDITTDPIDPPRFDALARLRAATAPTPPSMPGSIPPSSSASPIPTSSRWSSRSPPQKAYDATLDAGEPAQMAGDRRPPAAPPRRDGQIEAVARTPIMGFREDVSIRITARRRRTRASICARRRAISSTISAATPRASSKLIEDINEAAATTMRSRRRRSRQRRRPRRRRRL